MEFLKHAFMVLIYAVFIWIFITYGMTKNFLNDCFLLLIFAMFLKASDYIVCYEDFK